MASTPEATTLKANASNPPNIFSRLVRTMSGRSIATDVDVIPSATPPATNQATTQSATSMSSQTRSRRRSGISEKLKKLAQDLQFKGSNKTTLMSSKITTGDVFDATIGDRESESEQVSHAKVLSVIMELAESENSAMKDPSSSATPTGDSFSPSAFVKHLRDLIDPLPFPSFSTPIEPPKLPEHDTDGRPIPPPSSSPISDPKLIDLLYSATFMNGSRKENGPRSSVWDLLESLSMPPHGLPLTEEQPSDRDGTGGEDNTNQPDDNEPGFFAGISSVMVCSPLIPGEDDLVELAELVPIVVQEEIEHDISAVASWMSNWPLSLISGQAQAGIQAAVMEAPTSHHLSREFIVSSEKTTVNSSGKKMRVISASVWVPSTTKLSFQAMWWGYRLWLPPHVMAILSDESLEATKRASLIATALAWVFNKIPVNLFPPPVQPALLLLQRIVPYLGYIATFISWSWSTIKSYDVGNGVTLTATWLLPVALIPGTWFDRDLPNSSTPNPPTGIPGTPASTHPPQTSPASPQKPADTPTTQPTSPQKPADTPTTQPTSPQKPADTPTSQPTSPATNPTPSHPQPPSQSTPQIPSQPTPQPPEQSPQPPVNSPGPGMTPADPPVQQPGNPTPGTGSETVPLPKSPVPDASPVLFAKLLISKLFSKRNGK